VSEHAFRLAVMGATLLSGLAVLCEVCIVLRMYKVAREMRPRIEDLTERIEDLTERVKGDLNAAIMSLDENRPRIVLIAENGKELSRSVQRLAQRIASLEEAVLRKQALMRTIVFIRGISTAIIHSIHSEGRTDPNVRRKRDTLFMGASLAFYTLLSSAPILVIVIAVAAFVYGQQAAQGQLVWEIQDLVGPDRAVAIQSLITNPGQA
jgi:hypothetical protein